VVANPLLVVLTVTTALVADAEDVFRPALARAPEQAPEQMGETGAHEPPLLRQPLRAHRLQGTGRELSVTSS
jgi:hypothetical protein